MDKRLSTKQETQYVKRLSTKQETQYVKIDPKTKTSFEQVKCEVPQGSIVAPLLFLLYANDLKDASSFLDLTMFARRYKSPLNP